MKAKILLGFLACIGGIGNVQGQGVASAIAGKAYLDVNNLKTSVNAYGSMWYNEATVKAECEYPKGSGKHAGFAAALWVSGKTDTTLRVAAQTYRQYGRTDYYPGPLNVNNTSDTNTAKLWNKVWSVRASTIRDFRQLAAANPTPGALAAATSSPAFDGIKQWPAKGSNSAVGANNQFITGLTTATRSYAPFVDVDFDGKYDWTKGDYPKIKGDAMLWTVFNDATAPKTQSGTLPIGLEVQLSVYAYDRGTIANNIQFYEYELINRGQKDLDSARIAIWTDIDLGWYLDDYIGFDSARRMGYAYNGMAKDSAPQPNTSMGYGLNPPASGIVFLQTGGDVLGNPYRTPLGAFNYFTQGTGVPACIMDPNVGKEFDRHMRSKNRCGDPFTNDFTGAANVNTKAYGTGPAYPYAFSGNPSVPGQWSECYGANPPGDRRFVMASSDFKFTGNGTSQTFAFALVVAPETGGCGGSIDLTKLQATADTARKLYESPPIATGVPEVSVTRLMLYPNPARDQILLTTDVKGCIVEVYSADGRILAIPTTAGNNGIALDISTLAPGIYAVRVTGENDYSIGTFIKE